VSTTTTDKNATRMVTNLGTRRLVIGPGPKSQGGDRKLIKFDTPADTNVPAGKRLGQVHTIDRAVMESPAVKAMGEKLGLKVA
jgi:hypothetical protein